MEVGGEVNTRGGSAGFDVVQYIEPDGDAVFEAQWTDNSRCEKSWTLSKDDSVQWSFDSVSKEYKCATPPRSYKPTALSQCLLSTRSGNIG